MSGTLGYLESVTSESRLGVQGCLQGLAQPFSAEVVFEEHTSQQRHSPSLTQDSKLQVSTQCEANR